MTTKTNIEAVNSGQTEREAWDVALDALDEYQRNWDTGLPAEYASTERIAMECAVEAVREALKDARAEASAPKMLAVCCGRPECGGECGNEWQGMRQFEPIDNSANPTLIWAVGRWFAEVADRPLINVHRRTLDDTWRQVIRHCGGDPDALLGPDHSRLMELAK